ncbi:MAG: hypothetical protein ACYC1D_06215 [Acidimicrobiales bacterium]
MEVAPGYVRLRHQLGLRSKFGRGRLSWPEMEVVRQLEDLEEAGESIEFEPLEPDEEAAILAAEEDERRWNEEAFLDSLSNEEVAEYFEAQELDAARKAAQERLGRGAKGMSERSRREMWRWVLSLPFDLLGDRPLWITLTYPGDWRRWVPDGRTLERHRRAFGEAWYRGFGERPIGFWSKEFQLAEGRPHLHLLMKGPKSMSEADYRGFLMLTRLGNSNVRKHGKHQGRHWTPPVGAGYGGQTAAELLRVWSNIVTDGTDEKHARRGVNVRTVFYATDGSVAQTMRRSAIAAYMAGEAAKAKQKVPPDDFGTVGRYFGTFGHRAGFKPTVEMLEVEQDVWHQLNRRLTLLDAMRKRASGRPLSEEAKKRKHWQGLTVGGVGPDEYGKLYARSYEAAVRKPVTNGQNRGLPIRGGQRQPGPDAGGRPPAGR